MTVDAVGNVVEVPAEVPPLMMGFKRQQSRWATGTVQCLRKLGGQVLRSPLTPWQKIQAMIHLGGYFIHPLLIVLLASHRIALDHGEALIRERSLAVASATAAA